MHLLVLALMIYLKDDKFVIGALIIGFQTMQ